MNEQREALAEALEQAVCDLNNRGAISDGYGWEEIAQTLLASEPLARLLVDAEQRGAARALREAAYDLAYRTDGIPGRAAAVEWLRNRAALTPAAPQDPA